MKSEMFTAGKIDTVIFGYETMNSGGFTMPLSSG
jgi:hypothetical protein